MHVSTQSGGYIGAPLPDGVLGGLLPDHSGSQLLVVPGAANVLNYADAHGLELTPYNPYPFVAC
jgi:hypothetical protein